MECNIITNNPTLAEHLENDCEIHYFAVTLSELLVRVRDLIHAKHQLLTHPLSGSVKPGETPFKSMMISREPGHEIDTFSLSLIESAIRVVDQMPDFPETDERRLAAYALVDRSLIESALRSTRMKSIK